MRGLSLFLQTDRKVSGYFAAQDNRWLKGLFRAFSRLGTGAVWISVYALCLIFFPDHAGGLIKTLILAELLGLTVIVILRYLTRRERPSANYRCFYLTPWNRYSFPSHHAFRAFVIAILIGTNHPEFFPALIITAAIVGFSRIYLLKHYLSDVLAGILLAVVVASASHRFLMN